MSLLNLLQNGSLAQPFRPFRNQADIQVVAGWAPWWEEPRPGMPRWRNQRPEFRDAVVGDKPAQMVSTPYGTHVAGLWQQVPAAEGNEYDFSVQCQAWSSEGEVLGVSRDGSEVNVRVGIDPTGGMDPASPLIVWSEPVQPLDHWATLRVSGKAEATLITVFLFSAPTLPKRNQALYWRDAVLLPVGRYRRRRSVVGPADTHIIVEPEHPNPDEKVRVLVSGTRGHAFTDLLVFDPEGELCPVEFVGTSQGDGRHFWSYTFRTGAEGLYDIRFTGENGARLYAQHLARASRQTQLVPSGEPRTGYRRVYILLPPTATRAWATAAVKGSFDGRYTVGFSADDAGVGDLDDRVVVAVNPHHWPGVLTGSWFEQNYPGTRFIPLVANRPEDLEAWLKKWSPEENGSG